MIQRVTVRDFLIFAVGAFLIVVFWRVTAP